jgi:hypothetical protein
MPSRSGRGHSALLMQLFDLANVLALPAKAIDCSLDHLFVYGLSVQGFESTKRSNPRCRRLFAVPHFADSLNNSRVSA